MKTVGGWVESPWGKLRLWWLTIMTSKWSGRLTNTSCAKVSQALDDSARVRLIRKKRKIICDLCFFVLFFYGEHLTKYSNEIKTILRGNVFLEFAYMFECAHSWISEWGSRPETILITPRKYIKLMYKFSYAVLMLFYRRPDQLQVLWGQSKGQSSNNIQGGIIALRLLQASPSSE